MVKDALSVTLQEILSKLWIFWEIGKEKKMILCSSSRNCQGSWSKRTGYIIDFWIFGLVWSHGHVRMCEDRHPNLWNLGLEVWGIWAHSLPPSRNPSYHCSTRGWACGMDPIQYTVVFWGWTRVLTTKSACSSFLPSFIICGWVFIDFFQFPTHHK